VLHFDEDGCSTFLRGWFGLQWHNVHAKFRENLLTVSKVKGMYRKHGELISLYFSSTGKKVKLFTP
jgi:hypothetical protein